MQQALIVDDSKTAQASLAKMLDRHDYEATWVESAELALAYLQHHHPDLIFMDHMMPGMDGFDAVKAIKSDPAIANIPIVMHTTKHGEMYVGQVRALGAVDILTKPANDEDLIAVLQRVDNLSHVLQSAVSSPAVFMTGEMKIVVAEDIADVAAAELESPVSPVNKPAVISGGNLDNDISDASAAPVTTSIPAVNNGSVGPSLILRLWYGCQPFVWLLATAWLLYFYLPEVGQIDRQRAQHQALLAATEWALNQQENYDYGELPLSGERLEGLKTLVGYLHDAGVQGTIRMEGHVGEFCLSRLVLNDGSSTQMLPKPELQLSACHFIGASAGRALQQSVQQSERFQAYVEGAGLFAVDAPIKLQLKALGASQPKHRYPADIAGMTTGDWNAVALNNNRVHFVLDFD